VWLQAAARTTAAERARCAAIVERWNEQTTHDWSPAIGTALKAGYRWIDVYGLTHGSRHNMPNTSDPNAEAAVAVLNSLLTILVDRDRLSHTDAIAVLEDAADRHRARQDIHRVITNMRDEFVGRSP
jgi:hypothetical protein